MVYTETFQRFKSLISDGLFLGSIFIISEDHLCMSLIKCMSDHLVDNNRPNICINIQNLVVTLHSSLIVQPS